jgi:hypothetical protein
MRHSLSVLREASFVFCRRAGARGMDHEMCFTGDRGTLLTAISQHFWRSKLSCQPINEDACHLGDYFPGVL